MQPVQRAKNLEEIWRCELSLQDMIQDMILIQCDLEAHGDHRHSGKLPVGLKNTLLHNDEKA